MLVMPLLLLVQAASLVLLVLAWIATSLALHQLLLFYPERIEAVRAARKKFIVARLGDTALLGACVLLFLGYGTLDIPAILAAAREGSAPAGAGWAARTGRVGT